MRGEVAEVKVSYEAKLSEALQMIDAAQKKFDEAEDKLLAAKSLEAESIRSRSASLRSLQDIEDHEDQLRRDKTSFELEYALNFLVKLSLLSYMKFSLLSSVSILSFTARAICEIFAA